MFVQAEAAERFFCYIVVKRNFTIIEEYFQWLFLIDIVLDFFQCFSFEKIISGWPLFYLWKKSLPEICRSVAAKSDNWLFRW